MKRRGYEVKCSPATAKVLGAVFNRVYQGLGMLHYDQGHLWWIE
jgi:hypothetical protein